MAAPKNRLVTVSIAAGASLSGATSFPLDQDGYQITGIVMPAAWDAAGLTFQGSVDDTTYGNVVDATGAEVSATVAAGQYLAVPPALLQGISYLKLRSGTSAVPVVQAAKRDLTLVLSPA
jgi:hypothetical protein